MNDTTKSISCPKCGTRNESERVYCWVCYQDLTSGIVNPTPNPPSSPAVKRRPAMISPGVPFSGDKSGKDRVPNRWDSLIWNFILVMLGLSAGLFLLILVTCGGMFLTFKP